MSVYFISARELDLVKIGYAYNPLHRYKHLRTFSPVALTLEGAIPGGYAKERELHGRFALARIHGEWFKLTPSLQAEIDASSRPEKFTHVGVRVWLNSLSEADRELERQAIPAEVVARREREFQERLAESARLAKMNPLERLVDAGDIHFPFRTRAAA